MMMMTLIGVLLLMSFVISGSEAQLEGESCVAPNGRQGTCISIRECPTLLALLSHIRSGVIPVDQLRRAICHLGKEPLVCCGAPTIPINPPSSSSPSTPQGQFLLPERCGVQGLVEKIVGGEPAPLGAWPWMVAFRGREGARRIWFCGGSLITDRYILSAAHCFRRNIEQIIARIGEHTFSENPDSENGLVAPSYQDIAVESIIVHQSYNHSCESVCNDIALIRLSEKATLHDFVMPICLPSNPKQDMGFSVQDFTGMIAWAAGWGTIEADPAKFRAPDVLQQVQLPINQSTIYCNFKKSQYHDSDMIICAGGEGNDACRGDSGGPLTLTNNDGTKHFLVGITSRGPVTCGLVGTSGIYTSVHYYMDWIMQHLA